MPTDSSCANRKKIQMTRSGRISKRSSPTMQLDVRSMLKQMSATKNKFQDNYKAAKLPEDLREIKEHYGNFMGTEDFNLVDVASADDLRVINAILRLRRKHLNLVKVSSLFMFIVVSVHSKFQYVVQP
jgi:hypothetical protein